MKNSDERFAEKQRDKKSPQERLENNGCMRYSDEIQGAASGVEILGIRVTIVLQFTDK